MSNIQPSIEMLKAELEDLYNRVSTAYEALDALKAESLRVQTSMPAKFELWVPKGHDVYYAPIPIATCYVFNHNWSDSLTVERGLAFQSEQDAAEVGKWLAAWGKVGNMAKQMNKGKVFASCGKNPLYWCIVVDSLAGLYIEDFSVTQHGPRFHSREAAERALELLTTEERETLVRGIA